jgi:hypothetical protein
MESSGASSVRKEFYVEKILRQLKGEALVDCCGIGWLRNAMGLNDSKRPKIQIP